MNKLILAGLIALTALSSCEWITADCDLNHEPEAICGDPAGSIVVISDLRSVNAEFDGETKYHQSEWEEEQSDTLTICDLPRTYFISLGSHPDYITDTLDWEPPVEAFNIERRDDIQAISFSVMEGTHSLAVRVKGRRISDNIEVQWSNWVQWHWILTLEE